MNLESKQRIIGIVVLIAFIALLIPFLFTSGIKKRHDLAKDNPIVEAFEEAEQSQAKSEVPVPIFMEKVTVEELKDKTQPVSDQMPEQPSPADVSYSVEGVINSQATVADKNVPGSPNNKIDIKSTDSTEQVVKPAVEPKNSSTKTQTTNGASTSSAGSKAFWSIQVGSFSQPVRADNLVSDLQNKGYEVYLQKITTTRGDMVRVLVGRESSRTKAKALAKRLKTKLNLDGHVVTKKL